MGAVTSSSDARPMLDLLPPELLFKIFSELKHSDILSRAALICKKWHAMSIDNALWKNLLQRDLPQWTLLTARPQVNGAKKEELVYKEVYKKAISLQRTASMLPQEIAAFML